MEDLGAVNVIPDIDEVMDLVGAPTLVTSLLNEGLLDELRLIVHPLLLAGGRALFEKVTRAHTLQFMQAEPIASGKVILSYRT